jgi:hypothetical protein
VGDVFTKRNEGAPLKEYMRNYTGSLRDFQLLPEDAGVVCASGGGGGGAGGGDGQPQFILSLPQVILLIFHLTIHAYASKVASGKKATGFVSVDDVWALVKQSGLSTGTRLLCFPYAIFLSVVTPGVTAGDRIGVCIARPLFFLSSADCPPMSSTVADMLQRAGMPRPGPLHLPELPDFFADAEENLQTYAIVHRDLLPCMLFGLTPLPREIHLNPEAPLGLSKSGCGCAQPSYRCLRYGDPGAIGKGVGCPFDVTMVIPWATDTSLCIIISRATHSESCIESKFTALAPDVERGAMRHLEALSHEPNYVFVTAANTAAVDAGARYDAACTALRATGRQPRDTIVGSGGVVHSSPLTGARARGKSQRALSSQVLSPEWPMCLCGCTSVNDAVGGTMIECANANACTGSFGGWYHMDCISKSVAAPKNADDPWTCAHCSLNLPSVSLVIKGAAQLKTAGGAGGGGGGGGAAAKAAPQVAAVLLAMSQGAFLEPQRPAFVEPKPVQRRPPQTAALQSGMALVTAAMASLTKVCFRALDLFFFYSALTHSLPPRPHRMRLMATCRSLPRPPLSAWCPRTPRLAAQAAWPAPSQTP